MSFLSLLFAAPPAALAASGGALMPEADPIRHPIARVYYLSLPGQHSRRAGLERNLASHGFANASTSVDSFSMLTNASDLNSTHTPLALKAERYVV